MEIFQILDTQITCHSLYIKHSHKNIYQHFNISSALKFSITEEDVKIRFSEILKVNVFQDPYVNEITCADPFQ